MTHVYYDIDFNGCYTHHSAVYGDGFHGSFARVGPEAFQRDGRQHLHPRRDVRRAAVGGQSQIKGSSLPVGLSFLHCWFDVVTKTNKKRISYRRYRLYRDIQEEFLSSGLHPCPGDVECAIDPSKQLIRGKPYPPFPNLDALFPRQPPTQKNEVRLCGACYDLLVMVWLKYENAQNRIL